MTANRCKKWPFVLALILLSGLIVALTPFGHALLQADVHVARWANSWVGVNPVFDNLLISTNTKGGDRVVFVCFAVFCLLHSFALPRREEITKRLAFWGWLAVVFIVCYLVQELAEDFFARHSPGKVLHGWRNLEQMYGRDVKVISKNSFPSGHATVYWICAFMTWPRFRRLSVVLFGLALVLPTTRVLVGAHWPSDIFLGSLPMSFLFTLIAYETRLQNVEKYLYRFTDAGWDIVFAREAPTLCDRLQAARHSFWDPKADKQATLRRQTDEPPRTAQANSAPETKQ